MIKKNGSTTRQIIGRFHLTSCNLSPQLSDFFHELLIFTSTGSYRCSVCTYNAIVILFRAIQRLAITISTDKVASTGKYAPPIHLPWLKFHYSISTLYGSEKVIGKSNTQRISYSISAATNTFIVSIHHIASITLKIKCRAATYMSFLIIRNIVSSHPLVLCIFFNQQTLFIQKVVCLTGSKTAVIQNLMMIHKHLGSFRKSYFIKRRINLTPKSRSPGIIQCFNVMMIFFT